MQLNMCHTIQNLKEVSLSSPNAGFPDFSL